MKKKNMVIPWLSLSCILMGMLLSFNSVFECNMYTEKHVLPILFISGIVLFLVLYLRANYAVIFTLSAIAGMGIFALTKIERLQQDFLSVVYYINNKSMAYNNKVFTPFEGKRGDMDENLFLLMGGVLFAVFIVFFAFRLHNCWYGMLPVYAVVCLGMAVGKTPDKAAVAFLVVGISMAMAWVSRQEHGGRRSFLYKNVKRQRPVWTYAILCAVLSAGLMAAWQYGQQTEDYVLRDAKKYLERQHEMERQVKHSVETVVQYIRAKSGFDSDGTLSNAEPRYTNKAVMKLTSSVKPNTTLYLRGFAGGEYENGKWKECDTESFREIMSGQKEEGAVLNAGYKFCKYWESYADTKKADRIKIEQTGAGKNSKFAYLPYFSNIYSVSNGTSEECIVLDGENGIRKKQDEYYLNYFNIGKKELDVLGYWDGGRDAMADVLKYRKYDGWSLPDKKLERYFDYVEEFYSSLPETGLPRLRALAEALILYDDTDDKVEGVREFLEQQAVYDKKLDPVPAGKDYAEYFLFDQQRGFCEHFATAGTLLLRAYHIPARYATGYKVTPDQFRKNKDGTYTAAVLDSDAHAWAEVFNAYFGWYPAEMTPGQRRSVQDGNGESLPQQTLSPVSKDGEREKQIKKPKETVTPTPKPAKQPQNNGGGKRGRAFQGRGLFLVLFPVIILLILIPAGYVFYQRYLQRKYRKMLENQKEDKNAAVRTRTELFLLFLRKCGKRRLLQKNEAEWFAFLAEEYKEMEEEIWKQLKMILQEAEFSNQNISQEKYDFFFDSMAKTERLILSKLSWIKRGFMRIIGYVE